ncbi:MAG: tetratricopeptide repeat protein [Actinomycetota bacterium]
MGRLLYFSGDAEAAAERIETALDIAEALGLPEVLSQALNTKSITLLVRGRKREASALLQKALDMALENEVPSAALRAYFNLVDAGIQSDVFQEAREYLVKGLTLARRVGHRQQEWQFLGQIYPMVALGEWDEALDMASGLPQEAGQQARLPFICLLAAVPLIHIHRGEIGQARRAHELFGEVDKSADVQERASSAVGDAALARAEGRAAEALELASAAFEAWDDLGIGHEAVKDGFVEAVEAAFAVEDTGTVERLLGVVDGLPQGRRPQYLDAHSRRFRSRLAASRGESDRVEPGFKNATGMFREMAVPFWMAVTLLEHGEWLVAQGRSDEAKSLLDEAREIFERLRARPWLERLERTGVGAARVS